MNFKDRMTAWFSTRPYGRLWRSLPALAAAVACAGFGLVLVQWSPLVTSTHYAAMVDRALAKHDFKTAEVAGQRRLALGVSPRPETLFKLAQALDGLGQRQEAYAIMIALAPGDHPGYAPAHLALAEALLSRQKLTAPILRVVELHLAYVAQLEPHSGPALAMKKYLLNQFQAWETGRTNLLKLDPNALETHEVAGWIEFQMQDWKDAKPHLLAEVAANPAVNFMLVDLARATGDEAGVRHWTEQAEQAYHTKVETDKVDVPADRLAWVQAEARLGKFEAARQILENGQQLSGVKIYAAALGSLYAAWAQQLSRAEPTNLTLRLQCLQQGLAADSKNNDLLLQLEAFSRVTGPEAKTAQAMLDKLLTEGPEASLRLSLLGMAAWQQGDLDTAHKFFIRAYAMDPDQPMVANNMALMLAVGDQGDPERGLAIIQKLLEKQPEQPHYRDTRGQILVILGRFEEAVPDLEYALPRLDSKQETERSLGKAYRLISARNGNKKLMSIAEHYEKLAEDAAQGPPASPK